MFDNQEILLKYVNKSNFYPVYLVRNKKIGTYLLLIEKKCELNISNIAQQLTFKTLEFG